MSRGGSLSHRTGRGLLWSALESFGSTGVSFVVSVVMAAFISPVDFGLVAMIQVFVAIARLIAEGSMTQALVRLPAITEAHKATAWGLNFAGSLAVYLLLYLCAPLVATWYGNQDIVQILRVLGVAVPLGALGVVHASMLTAGMRFGRLAAVSGVAVIISGAVGILLAVAGLGVWAIVWQQVSMWGLRSLLLMLSSPAMRLLSFDFSVARSLLGFSWKLVCASLIDTIWSNMYASVIGLRFSPRAAGLFWRAESCARLPLSTAASVVSRVAYPLFSRASSRPGMLHVLFGRMLGMTAWWLLPCAALLCALAEPLFRLIFNEQWLPAAPLLSIISIAMAFYPIHALNLTLLNVEGRSDLFLRLEVIKKLLTLLTLFITLPMGVMAVCVGMVVNSLIALPVNMYYSGSLARWPVFLQLRLIMPCLLLACLGGGVAYAVSRLFAAAWASLLVGLFAGAGSYLCGSALLRLPWLRRVIHKTMI